MNHLTIEPVGSNLALASMADAIRWEQGRPDGLRVIPGIGAFAITEGSAVTEILAFAYEPRGAPAERRLPSTLDQLPAYSRTFDGDACSRGLGEVMGATFKTAYRAPLNQDEVMAVRGIKLAAAGLDRAVYVSGWTEGILAADPRLLQGLRYLRHGVGFLAAEVGNRRPARPRSHAGLLAAMRFMERNYGGAQVAALYQVPSWARDQRDHSVRHPDGVPRRVLLARGPTAVGTMRRYGTVPLNEIDLTAA